MKQVSKAQKQKARELAGEAIQQIVDAAQVLTDVRPILAADEKKDDIKGARNAS